MLLSKFDKIFLINLDRRPDRLKICRQELSKFDILFERVSAVDGQVDSVAWNENAEYTDEFYGWNRSSAALLETTIQIIRKAIHCQYEAILIFEDDISLVGGFDRKLEKLTIPDDWQFIYLGYLFNRQSESLKKNRSSLRLKKAFGCHAYAIASSVYEEYLEALMMRYKPIDWIIHTHFQQNGRCYGPTESLVNQLPGYSDIRGKTLNYQAMPGFDKQVSFIGRVVQNAKKLLQ